MAAAPQPSATPRTELFVFDAARAGAAGAVLLAHARSFFLLDAKDQPGLSSAGQVFYGVSGLGHQAVIVFFVISGALVTRALVALESSGRWSATTFAIARLTRLWVVLIPCLLLGGLLDRLGEAAGDGLVYAGLYGALRPDAPPVPIHLDGPTLLGNLAFLQTIVVAPFGTNVPLWSLANEGWYYVLAFLAFAFWRERRPGPRLVCAALASAIAAGVMTRTLWVLAPPWALGAATALAWRREPVTAGPRLRWVAIGTLVAALVIAKLLAVRGPLLGDYAVAVAAAFVMVAYRHGDAPAQIRRPVAAIAAMSYSLYLSHFPLLALLAAIGPHNQRLPLGPAGLLWLGTALGLALVYAAALWWLFERHTAAVRRWAEAVRTRAGAHIPAPRFRRDGARS